MAPQSSARVVMVRWIGLLVIWIVITGASPSDMPAGIITAGLATWASRFISPARVQINARPLLRLCQRLLSQALMAGVDIARRALSPSLRLNPGVIRFQSKLSPSHTQAAFNMIITMVPGTLPLGTAKDGALLVHCLDVAQPLTSSLARDESLWLRVIGRADADG